MSMFNQSSHTDASGSNFSNVGHDQYTHAGRDQHNLNIHHTVINNITISIGPTATEQGTRHVLRNLNLLHSADWQRLVPPSYPRVLPQRQSPVSESESHNNGDVAVRLVAEIARLLVDPSRAESSVECRALKLELDSFGQTLTLTRLAVQAYEDTPLGRSLSKSIDPEVERCCVVLEDTLDNINGHRQGLHSTSISSLWRRVWWSGNELAQLRTKLSACQRSLGVFLLALKSIKWEDLGNGLRAGSLSLKDFHTYLGQFPLSLRHIQVPYVFVVDHLGRNIPVPTIFCSTWEAFDYLISGYCKDRPGHDFVERGDYQMIRAEDSLTVDPSEFVRFVEPGIVLEMSIIVQQSTALKGNKGKCPRCQYVNRRISVPDHGWIECRRCSGHFQFSNMGFELSRRPISDNGGGVDWHVIQFFRRICLVYQLDQQWMIREMQDMADSNNALTMQNMQKAMRRAMADALQSIG